MGPEAIKHVGSSVPESDFLPVSLKGDCANEKQAQPPPYPSPDSKKHARTHAHAHTHTHTHTRQGKQIKTKRPWVLPLHVTGSEMAFTQRAEEEAGLAPPAAHRTFISVSHLHCHVKTYPQQPSIFTSISPHSLLPQKKP